MLKDDIIDEETDQVQEALKRLTDKETFDRNFRMRRAVMLSARYETLPKDQHTKPEDDVRYLMPHIFDIYREAEEKKYYEKKQKQ